MSTFIPKFKLYDSTGTTLLYTFETVQATNAPQSVKKSIVIESIRGKGSLIIDGGEDSWDLIIKGIFIGSDHDSYKQLVVKMDSLESAIILNTAYKLRIDKTESTYYEYNVKRIDSIEYSENLRTNSQEYEVTFKVNSW